MGHLEQIPRDRFRLSSLLSLEAGEGSGGVQQGDDGPVEFRCQFHQAERLSVPLGVWHAEIPSDVRLRVSPLLVTEDEHAITAQSSEAANDRLVVADAAVAVKLDEI